MGVGCAMRIDTIILQSPHNEENFKRNVYILYYLCLSAETLLNFQLKHIRTYNIIEVWARFGSYVLKTTRIRNDISRADLSETFQMTSVSRSDHFQAILIIFIYSVLVNKSQDSKNNKKRNWIVFSNYSQFHHQNYV